MYTQVMTLQYDKTNCLLNSIKKVNHCRATSCHIKQIIKNASAIKPNTLPAYHTVNTDAAGTDKKERNECGKIKKCQLRVYQVFTCVMAKYYYEHSNNNRNTGPTSKQT